MAAISKTAAEKYFCQAETFLPLLSNKGTAKSESHENIARTAAYTGKAFDFLAVPVVCSESDSVTAVFLLDGVKGLSQRGHKKQRPNGDKKETEIECPWRNRNCRYKE